MPIGGIFIKTDQGDLFAADSMLRIEKMDILRGHRSTEKLILPNALRELKSLLKDVRYHVGAVLAAFLAGIIVGLYQPEHLSKSFKYFGELAGFLRDQNAVLIIIFLFLKNALASFIVLWGGALLGIVPLLAAVQNGILMGAVLSRQESVFFSLLSILPHGIFELPAFFTACGIGIWRGLWLFRNDKRETYKERVRKGYLAFFRLILPLLIIAAVIEGGCMAY
jgi:stage II sporulation protein M